MTKSPHESSPPTTIFPPPHKSLTPPYCYLKWAIKVKIRSLKFLITKLVNYFPGNLKTFSAGGGHFCKMKARYTWKTRTQWKIMHIIYARLSSDFNSVLTNGYCGSLHFLRYHATFEIFCLHMSPSALNFQ